MTASAWPGRALALAVGAALVGGSLLWMSLTHAHPSFDAYGWLTWGRQTWAGALNTGAAPSWKPLPYAFTLPFALFGNTQLWLWSFAATVLGLSGTIFAFRAAARLSSVTAEAPAWLEWPVLAGGLLGAGAYLCIYGLWHQLLITDSDPIVVSACLAALDLHLAGRPRWCLTALMIAALGRPEAWPILALYMAWLVVAGRGRGRVWGRGWGLAAGYLLFVPAAWFVIPGLTSKSPLQAGNAALGFHTAILHGDRIPVVLSRFAGLYDPAVWVVVIASFLTAIWQRSRVRLALYGLVAIWLATEIAFAFHDWPADPRYLMEPAAVLGVLAAAWVARVLDLAQTRLRRRELRAWLIGAGAAGIGIAVVAAMIPFGVGRAGALVDDSAHERMVSRQMSALTASIQAVGGYRRIDHCAPALTLVGDESAVAWNLHQSVGDIAHRPGIELKHHIQAVYIRPRGRGPALAAWRIAAINLSRGARARCGGIPVAAGSKRRNVRST